MPKNVKKYKLLISCPSDIKKEKEIIHDEVEKFNRVHGDSLGIQIETADWEKSVYPTYGDKPQSIINKQLLPKCDAVVALFWSRIGSPTDKYASGTIEEMEEMALKGKQVFLYFSNNEINPEDIDIKQLEKLRSFKEENSDNCLYGEYDNVEEFRQRFSVDMPKFFMDIYQEEKHESVTNSKLKLKGIENGNTIDVIKASKFVPEMAISKDIFKAEIKDKIIEVNNIKLEKSKKEVDSSGLVIDLHSKVSINDGDRKIIRKVAELLDITLKDDFFDLGNLESSLVPDGLYGTYSLKGSKQECKKYDLINSILQSIDEMRKWVPVEEKFFCLDAIKMALTNSGTTYDEDIEVSLYFSKNSILKLGEFPLIDNDGKDYIMNNVGLFEIFGIHSSAHYMNFFEPEEPLTYHPISDIGELIGKYDYSDEDYIIELSKAFCYSLFEEDNNMILKIKFKYIKQNTTIAFPSVIFLNKQIETIKYVITSKNNPDIIEGEIKVVNE